MVISSRNPVHSVLFLILAFFNAAGLFLLLGAEFLAMILVVVYVGAVAVLFLFVVMMLDVDFAEFKQGFLQISAHRRHDRRNCRFVELIVVVGGWSIGATSLANVATPIAARHDATRWRSAACSIRNMSICSRRRRWCCSPP